MAKLRLSVACGDYDIVKPLIEGTVQAEGLDLVFLTDMGPRERHWRMGRKHEFDVCEENIGAYFMMRDQGEPLTAIPVFLHRRFRHGFVFINTAAGIKRAQGSGRQDGRRHQLSAGLQHLDARHPGGALRRSAPEHHLAGRSQRGHRILRRRPICGSR